MLIPLYRIFSFAVLSALLVACSSIGGPEDTAVEKTPRVLIYGASGGLGGPIVDEALARGYRVTGVTRDSARLSQRAEKIDIVVSDILDRKMTVKLIREYDSVIVSVGGPPTDSNPANYIAARAAETLIDVLTPMGRSGPRVIFVGNLFTLEFEGGKTLLELGRAPESHPNFAMFHGHQIALDKFVQADDINWTVATPPNGLRLSGRTGQVRWGKNVILRDADGTPSTISSEDFAFAIMEELENGHYVRKRFTVAR